MALEIEEYVDEISVGVDWGKQGEILAAVSAKIDSVGEYACAEHWNTGIVWVEEYQVVSGCCVVWLFVSETMIVPGRVEGEGHVRLRLRVCAAFAFRLSRYLTRKL